MSKHAKLSCSGSKTWMHCAGQPRLKEMLQIEDSPNKYTSLGEAAHTLGEKCLKGNLEPEAFRGKVLQAQGFKHTVDQDMIDAVKTYTDFVRGRLKSWKEAGAALELSIERWLPLTTLKIDDLDGGTTDCMITIPDAGVIENYDYKNGKGLVEVEDNSQLLCYLTGAFLSLPKKLQKRDWSMTMGIIQPRGYPHHNDGPIRTQDITSKELMYWANHVLVPAAKATHEPNAPLTPGNHCTTCSLRGTCNVFAEYNQKTVMTDFKKFTPPEVLQPEQKIKIIENIDLIRNFLKEVEKQVTKEIADGSDGYKGKLKLVRKTTQRRFNPNAFDEITSPLLDHLEHDEMYVEKARGIGEIEKALIKHIGKEEAKEVMQEITNKPDGDLVVATVNDKRAEAKLSTPQDFNHLIDKTGK